MVEQETYVGLTKTTRDRLANVKYKQHFKSYEETINWMIDVIEKKEVK